MALGWDRAGVLALPASVIVLLVAFSVLSPVFLTLANFQEIAKDGSVIAILAFGQAIVVIARGFDLSIGGNMAVVSIVTATLAQSHPLGVAIVVGIALGASIGALNGLLIAVLKMSSLIVTLAVLSGLNSIAFQRTNGLPVYGMPDSYGWAGSEFLGPIPIASAVAGLMFVVALTMMRSTPFGLHLYASGSNPTAARLSGLAPARLLFVVFVLNGAIASLAGIILSSRLNSGQPALGQQGLELQVLAAVFLGGISLAGGRGSLVQVLFAVVLLTVLTNGLTLVGIESYARSVVSGVVLVAAIALQRVVLARQKSTVHTGHGPMDPGRARSSAS
jgi:ribose/xylose/arabinose/galactoside ABC-type transport system permease subunit